MLNFLKSYFGAAIQSQQSSVIERYIASKNPRTTADVEHWEKQYARKQQKGWVL